MLLFFILSPIINEEIFTVVKKVLSRKDHINQTSPAGISGLGRKSGMSEHLILL